MMNSVNLPSNIVGIANEELISDLQKLKALGQWRSCRVFAMLRIYTGAFPRTSVNDKTVSILGLSTENNPFKTEQGTYFGGYVQNQSGGARAKYVDGVLVSVDVICSVSNSYHSELHGGTVANSLVGLNKTFKVIRVVSSDSGIAKGVTVMLPFSSTKLCSHSDVETLTGPVFINVPHSVTHEDPNVVNLVQQVRNTLSTYTASVGRPDGAVDCVPVEVDTSDTTRADRIRDEAYRQCGVPLRS